MRAHINITKKSTPVLMSIVNRIHRFSHWKAGSICASKHQSWPIYDKSFSRQEITNLESVLSAKLDPEDIGAVDDLLFNKDSSHEVSIKKTIYFNAAIDNVLNKFVDYVCADKSIDVNRK